MDRKDLGPDFLQIRKDLLDDSNAAKDEMDKVKKKLKLLLRDGKTAPPQFAWPEQMPDPSHVLARVVRLLKYHRVVMRDNYTRMSGSARSSLVGNISDSQPAPNAKSSNESGQMQDINSIQSRWCCGEDPELFKERWEKLFTEFCDQEKVDPSKISELYDTMKYDALHNRAFLEAIFRPSSDFLSSSTAPTRGASMTPVPPAPTNRSNEPQKNASGAPTESAAESSTYSNLAQRLGLRPRAETGEMSGLSMSADQHIDSYFKLHKGCGDAKLKIDSRFESLRELYRLAKVLFDYIAPQEYGISNEEKLEIGLLTSLPLLKGIVGDLEKVQASETAKSFVYFTKESHIYTLLNAVLEGGIETKIERNKIPELDYLSQICFELYESENKEEESTESNSEATFKYSIRITISPGCHTVDPLDVQLDSKHCISSVPKRSLTTHHEWKAVIETLRSKFQR